MLYSQTFIRILVGSIAAMADGINITPNGSAITLDECKDAYYGTLADSDAQFIVPSDTKSLVLGNIKEKSVYIATSRQIADAAILPLVNNCDVKDVVEQAICKLNGNAEDYALVRIVMADSVNDSEINDVVMTIVADHFGYTAPQPAPSAAAAAAANSAPLPPMTSSRP